MIGIGLNIGNRVMGGGGGAFDVDAQAFFDRVTTAGGTLTTTEKNATNQLVLDMKSAGIWTAMKAVYPMVGASAAACAQNLKSSSFTVTFSSGWTFASSGITPNGTSAYADTGLNQSTNLTNTDLHCSYYANGGSFTGSAGEIGLTGSQTFLLLRPSAIYFNQCDGDYTIYSISNFGFYCGSRNSTTSRNGYFNGNLVISSFDPSVATSNTNYYFGALNTGSGAGFFSSLKTAFATIGTKLTSTQNADFYTAVQAFQTTLSRNV
ncbi:MAG: hypothetical protein EBR30_09210 [Cytophagia bacterium]|nr:hypothetical protein [Cytophagia bacterium]